MTISSEHPNDAGLVTVRSFGSEPEALVAKAALDAFGIDAMISSDDCGGQRLHLAITEGIRLMVRQEDAGSAEEVLSPNVEEA
jgi:hypothetical protein